jgi:hypothetical protein
MRTFTDTEGRTMEAKVTQVSGDDVYITRRDGLSTKVDISIFSKEDRDYIRDWDRRERITGGLLEVRLAERERNRTRWEQSRTTGIDERTWDGYYEVTVRNTGRLDLENIRVDYLQMKFSEEVGATERDEGRLRRVKGSARIGSLPAGEERSFTTEVFEMRGTRLQGNYYYTDGGKRESEDELEGIWVKVYAGDLLALEESRPLNLREKEAW